MAESLAPPFHEAQGMQGRRRSHPPVRCRDLGSLSESRSGYWSGFTNAACAPSLEVLKRASLSSIESVLLQVQLRWAGHITRMEDVRMPKAVFFSELQEGKSDRGAPRMRYKEQLRRQLVQAGISHQSWQQEALNRDSWRSSVRKASCEFKAERHKAAKEHPYHPHPKPSSVQSAVGDAHQESVSTATSEHARIDHHLPSDPRLRGMSHHHNHFLEMGFDGDI